MTKGAGTAVGIVFVSVMLGCGHQPGTAEAVVSKQQSPLKAGWHVSPSAHLPAPVVAATWGQDSQVAASKSQVLVVSYELNFDGGRVLEFARTDARYKLLDPTVRAVAPDLRVKRGEFSPGFAVASDGESFLIVGVSVTGDELLGVTVGADGQIGEPFTVGPCSGAVPNGIALASDGTGYVAAWVDGQGFRAAHIDVSKPASTPINFGAATPNLLAGYDPPALAANGAGYLLVLAGVWALRLNPDGTPKDAASFQVFSGLSPSVASDGQDFVVVGLASDTGGVIAQRVSAAGAKLGNVLSIELPPANASSVFIGAAPALAFVGSSFVTSYWEALNGGLRRYSFISQDVKTATKPATLPATLNPTGSPLYAATTPTGALLVTGAYATPVSSQLELGAPVLMEAKLADRSNFRSAAVGSEYLVAWQEEAPAFEATEQRLKAVTVTSSSSVPEPVLLTDAFDENSGKKFGDLYAAVADENGYLLSGNNLHAYIGKGPFKGFVPPAAGPWAAGGNGYLTGNYFGVLHALDTNGKLLSDSGVTPPPPCPASQRGCSPQSIAHRPGGYAVLWGNDASYMDSDRAAVMLTDEEGNVVVSKIIDSPGDAVASAIVSNGMGYLVFVPEMLDSRTQKWSERTVLQLDTDLNVVASNPTELRISVYHGVDRRYSDVVVSGGEYYAVYDKQRWKDELPHGPLWFAHLAADGTIAEELEVIAETTGIPVLASAGADSFLVTTSASETVFVRRGTQGGDAGAAGAGDVPASGGGESPSEVSGGKSAGGASGASEAAQDQSSGGVAGDSDGQTDAAPPKRSHDSGCSEAGVGAPTGSSWWPTLFALGLVGLARRRRGASAVTCAGAKRPS